MELNGSLRIDENLFVINGTTSLDTGQILTNGSGSLVISGSFTSDSGNLFTDSLGNITAISFTGAGTALTSLTAANITPGGTAPINISGHAATVTTNATLTGDVTSSGNVTTLAHIPAISGANLTSLTAANISAGTAGIDISGTAAFVTTNANLTGEVTSIGNATTIVSLPAISGANLTNLAPTNISAGTAGIDISGTAAFVTTNANLTGEVTSIGNATTIVSLPAISGANLTALTAANITPGGTAPINISGTAATVTTNANLTGDVTSSGNVTTVAFVGGSTAAHIHSAELAANAATATNTPDTIVLRDSSGDFSAGTITATLAGNASTATTAATVTAAAQPAITSLGVQTAALDMGAFNVINMANPASAQDAATKAYVDGVASGLTFHASVQLASTVAIPAYTYNNGAAGVGATITSNAFGLLTLDGVATTTGMRVLIKNEVGANAPFNGIYVVNAPGSVSTDFVLTRSTDANTPATLAAGASVFIDTGGLTQSATIWTQITPGTIVIGTTDLLYVQVAAPTQYSAGNGLTLIGTQFSLTTPVSIADGGTGTATTSQNFAFIGPTSGSGAPSFRLLVPGDVPTLNQNTTGNAATVTTNAAMTGDVTSTGLTNVTTLAHIPAISGANLTSLTAANISAGTAIGLNITGNAATATSIFSGAAGDVLYQSAPNVTAFVPAGTTGQALLSNGISAPTWGTPTNATNASDILGGAAGEVLYQSAPGITTFVSIGIAGQILQSNGAGSPAWITSVPEATAIFGGSAGELLYQSSGGVTTFVAAGSPNQSLIFSGGIPTWSNTVALATSVAGGSGGTILYQSGTNVTAFLPDGSTNQVLTFNGSIPAWSTNIAGNAGAATNILGGAAGEVPYQSTVNTTLFTAAGTSGQFLISGGTGSPTWTTNGSALTNLTAANISAGTAIGLNITGNAANVTGIVAVLNGGTGVATLAAHGVVIGEGTSNVAVTAAGTAGQPLVSGGASADPAFAALNIASGSAGITGILALANGGTGNTTGTATINANLTGGVTSVGNAATVITNANLTGDVTSVGNATHLVALGTTGTSVTVNTAAPPTTGQVLTATSATAANWETPVGGATVTRTQATGNSATTAFTIPTYSVGNNTLEVFIDGVLQIVTVDYTETSPTVVTFVTAPVTGALLSFVSISSSPVVVSNVTGGVAGEVLYQTGASATGFSAVGTAGQILESGGSGAPTWVSQIRAINAQAGTTYTFVLADGSQAGNFPLVTFGSGSATTVTVPTHASVAFPVGAQIECVQQGAGKVTFVGAGGVTINSQAGNLSIAAQYVAVSLIQRTADTWYLIGNLIA